MVKASSLALYFRSVLASLLLTITVVRVSKQTLRENIKEKEDGRESASESLLSSSCLVYSLNFLLSSLYSSVNGLLSSQTILPTSLTQLVTASLESVLQFHKKDSLMMMRLLSLSPFLSFLELDLSAIYLLRSLPDTSAISTIYPRALIFAFRLYIFTSQKLRLVSHLISFLFVFFIFPTLSELFFSSQCKQFNFD